MAAVSVPARTVPGPTPADWLEWAYDAARLRGDHNIPGVWSYHQYITHIPMVKLKDDHECEQHAVFRVMGVCHPYWEEDDHPGMPHQQIMSNQAHP